MATGWSLRRLYRTFATPGASRLRDAALDAAVRAAYGMNPTEGPFAFLLHPNFELVAPEAKGQTITLPGWPYLYAEPQELMRDDCVRAPSPA